MYYLSVMENADVKCYTGYVILVVLLNVLIGLVSAERPWNRLSCANWPTKLLHLHIPLGSLRHETFTVAAYHILCFSVIY